MPFFEKSIARQSEFAILAWKSRFIRLGTAGEISPLYELYFRFLGR